MKKKLKKLLEIDRQIKEHKKFIKGADDLPYYIIFGDRTKDDDIKAAKDELAFLYLEKKKIISSL